MRPTFFLTDLAFFNLYRFCGLLALSGAFSLPVYAARPNTPSGAHLSTPLLLGVGLVLLLALALARLQQQRTRWRQQQRRLALVDRLTGLPSRLAAEQYLGRKLIQAQQYNACFAVLQMTLHGFRWHPASPDNGPSETGLQAASLRLAACIREQDLFARLDGNTFIAIIACSSQRQVRAVVERLQRALAQPLPDHVRRPGVSLSIGISLYPQAGDVTGPQLLQQAGLALAAAEANRLGDAVFYTPALAIPDAAAVIMPAKAESL
jgi:diguanylate cyclase (GGDEF)-like protein